MDLAHAFVAGGLATRKTQNRFRTTEIEIEIREAERRVIQRRTAVAAASVGRTYTERGRHAAPGPARA